MLGNRSSVAGISSARHWMLDPPSPSRATSTSDFDERLLPIAARLEPLLWAQHVFASADD
jgi:hypothetical protein